jgi:hypothetical protein
MTADTRQSNGGRGGDDWLGAGELDWGEAPAGSRPPVRGSAPGEPLWPDHDRPEHADEATIRRRRLIGLIVLVAAVGFVIVVAVLAFGGGSSDDNAAVTLPTTTAQQPATTPTTTPKTSTTPKTTTTPQTPSTGTLTLAEGQTLRTGDSGEQVKQLQQALTTLGYKPGAVDGDFGATTANAVGEFQRANDLADDGVVGPATAQAINAAVANQSSAGAGTGTTAAAGA